MSTVTQLLTEGMALLGAEHRRDVEVLLCHCLGRGRSYLYTWPEAEVPTDQRQHFYKLMNARQRGEPVAYLVGEREFWSLPLKVTPATLIPRPDTELLVSTALTLCAVRQARVLDLGTGSGAVALALASERPAWRVCAVDNSAEALAQAQENARHLELTRVEFVLSNWFEQLAGERFDVIVSNPPYIAPDDEHLQQGDLRFEPQSALVSQEQGLADLRQIIQGATQALTQGGYLFLEHGYQQGSAVRAMLQQAGFTGVISYTDLADHERVSGGCWRSSSL